MTGDETLTIKPVQNKRLLKAFVKLPWRVYHGNPLWAPPLIREELRHFNPKKDPFYRHSEVQLLLATQGDEVVGRIAAFINRNHNQFHKDRTGFFGFFECLPEFSAARLLYDAAARWLRERGMDSMRGPMNFSTNEVCGFLLKGFDKPPVTMMPYTPKYYLDFAERFGLTKIKDLHAYLVTKKPLDLQKYKRMVTLMRERESLTVRPIAMNRWQQEIRKIRDMYNVSWSENWGFVPMTEAEFDYLAQQLKPILDPRFVLIVEKNQQLIGFALALPDISPALKKANGKLFPLGVIRFLLALRKTQTARVILLAVKPEFQRRGVAGLLILETARALVDAGYTAAEMSWTLEDNSLINKPIERLGAHRYKEYRIYQTPL